MQSLILYYSMSGHTKRHALRLAQETGAVPYPIELENPHGKALTSILGILQVFSGAKPPILPLPVDISDFDRILLAGPVWAGKQAPALNSAIALLPPGKEVSVLLVSGGGEASFDDISERIRAKRCTVGTTENVKG